MGLPQPILRNRTDRPSTNENLSGSCRQRLRDITPSEIMSKPILTFRRRWLLCTISGFLLAGKWLGQLMDPETRRLLFYGWVDFAVVMALLFGFGLAVAGFLHPIARASRGRSDRWLSPWFFFLAIQIVFNFSFTLWDRVLAHIPQWSQLLQVSIWAIGLALTGGGYAFSAMRGWATKGWRSLLVLSPILIIVPVQLAAADKWQNADDNPSRLGSIAGNNRAPIVILLFDTVGYDAVCTPDGQVRAQLANLAEFSKIATVYHQAKSAGDCTGISLPSIMLQEEVGNALFKTDATYWPSQNRPEIPLRVAAEFTNALPYRVKAEGGRSVYIGIYLPFKKMMPGAWDAAYVCSIYGAVLSPAESRWAASMWRHVLRYLRVSKDPISALARQLDIHVAMENDYWRATTQNITTTAQAYIRSCLSPGDLLFVHCPIPHSPFVFAADGTPNPLPREDVVGGYETQMEYADTVFGQWVDELKQAGQWEQAWVLMMADHANIHTRRGENWDYRLHVPLLVKAPGQTNRIDCHDPFRLVDLHAIPGFPAAADSP